MAGLSTVDSAASREVGKRADVVQRSQINSKGPLEKPKEAIAEKGTAPSPARRPHRFALEVTFSVEDSTGEFNPVDEDTYSADFLVDNFNLVYPGCTGIYLMEAGHVIAFYGKKGTARAGLSVEQSVDACEIMGAICRWLGQQAKFVVKAISLTEANETILGHKRLEKESLRKARQEVMGRLLAWRLGHIGNLSATAKPFMPLAASSSTAVAAVSTRATPPPPAAPPLTGNVGGGVPLYTSDNDGMTTDGGASRTSRRSSRQRGNRGGRRNRDRPPREGLVNDSGSESSASTLSVGRGRKKKAGVNAKVNIPNFGGKTSNPDNTASAFQCWARNVAYYREYYEDEYLMSTVVASCKDEAAEVFDMALDHNPGGDLGAIIRGMRHHYCGSLTFREQRNAVENMRQGSSEDAADFLVRVNSAVRSLGKDWQDTISQEELEKLRYEVAMNGVKLDVCHVLDSEVAKYGQLTSKQIYDAVKRYEAYAAPEQVPRGQRSLCGTPQRS